jgi:iron(III) transport system permease protein
MLRAPGILVGRRGALQSSALNAALLLVVVYLVVVPVVAVILAALRSVPLDVPGPFTLANLSVALESLRRAGTITNTLVFAGASTAVSLLIGGYLAWVTERTSTRVRTMVHVLVVVNLIVPGILTTVSWILLLHERIGIMNIAFSRAGLSGAFDAYTLPSMIWVDGSDGFALPFLLIAAAMRATDPSHEEAAASSGATRRQVLTTVTLPLLRPAILAAALLSFIRSLGTFVVPIAMGVPGGVRVLATDVYLQSRVFPSNANLAAAYALIHLAFALAALWAYHFATRGDGRFVTLGGRAGSLPRARTGARTRVHAFAAAALSLVVVALPASVMVYASLLPFYRAPWSGVPTTLDLRHYRWLMASGAVERAFVNNLLIGGLAAVAAVVLSLAIAWQVTRRPGRTARALDVVASLPVALPGTVLALALLWWYLYLPLPLYATRWVLVIGLLTTFLPYGVRTLQSGFAQLGVDLEEASALSGATRIGTLLHIVVPLLAPGIVAVTLYMVSRSFKALAIPALLGGPGLEMVPTVIYGLSSDARYPELSALGVVLSLGLAGLTLLARAIVAWRGGGR